MRNFHFSVRSVLRQNWCSELKCLRAFVTRVRTSCEAVRGTVAAECNAKIFGVLFGCEGGPFVKWTVSCEVGERSSTHFF